MLDAEQTASGATLEIDGETHYGGSLAQMIRRLTHWQLPTSQLPQWSVGQFNPATATQLAFNSQGQLLAMTERDQFGQQWQLDYSHYSRHHSSQSAEQPALPGRITLTHNDIKLKLIISQWHI